jgi:hypothetical protein
MIAEILSICHNSRGRTLIQELLLLWYCNWYQILFPTVNVYLSLNGFQMSRDFIDCFITVFYLSWRLQEIVVPPNEKLISLSIAQVFPFLR